MVNHLRATERCLPYGITVAQCHLPPTTGERTLPYVQQPKG